ncbi:VgrG-related protein [Rhodococcus aetherivorans]|uniref:VgrG-related protein n=1 Tax=Rhodococcus aetherivorans TaxID=191292 RepID=UPI003675F28A
MFTTAGFAIEIGGTALDDGLAAMLVYASVDLNVHLPDAFALRFRDPDRTLITKSGIAVGAMVKIAVTTDPTPLPEPLTTGEVTALEMDYDSTGTFTTVRGYDAAHRLLRGRRTASYTQVTASDVVEEVARRVGIELGTVDRTRTVFEHLSQCARTDWEFLYELARDVGFELSVRDNKLDFRPPEPAATAPEYGGASEPNPLILEFGKDLVRFRVGVTAAEQVAKVEVRGWDVTQKQPLVATAPAGTRSVELPTLTPATAAAAFDDPVHVAAEVPYRTQSEVDTAADALADRIGAAFAEIEAVVRGNARLKANQAVTLAGVGVPFDGKYTVTAAYHRLDPVTGYTTSISVTGRQPRSLRALTSGTNQHGVGHGLVVGVVTDAHDPLGHGRVRVKYPWLSDDFVSAWARTVQPGAGKDRGAMVVPEVGDEVLVGFELGDPEQPYVLGGLFNGVDTPNRQGPVLVDPNSGAINRRSWVSRRGHRIDLLDEDGRAEGITLDAATGAVKIALDAVGTAITITSNGTVTITGSRGVVLDAAAGKLDLRGTEVAVTAKGALTLDGATVSVKGKGTAEVSAAGPCIVKGAPVRIN